MEKKIAALKEAYRSNDRAKLRKAAQSLVAYSKKHPFAVVVNPGAQEIVKLAERISA